MKKLTFPILCCFLLLFSCCETECCEDKLIFNPINYTNDYIYMINNEYDKIYVIDTSVDKLIYIYDFNKNNLLYGIYNEKNLGQIYFRLNYDSNFYILNVKTGNVEKIEIDYSMMDLIIIDDKIQIVPNCIPAKGVARRCKIFNPHKHELEEYCIPEGLIASPIDMNIDINNKKYLPITYLDENAPTVYNITDKKILDFYPERNYVFFHFVGDKYLYAYHEETYFADVYEVTSFEPVNAKIIYTENYDVIGLRIFEDDDFLYVIDQLNEYVQITKRNKSDYSIVAQKEITKNYQPGGVPYFKNNHFWVTSLDDDGAYKISKDLEITVIK